MGWYLEVNDRENNSKSTSFQLAYIIRQILPNVVETDYGWILNKRHVAALGYFTYLLLLNDRDLKKYIEENPNCYGFDGNYYFEGIKNNIEWMHECFADTLIEMVLYKEKTIDVRWM